MKVNINVLKTTISFTKEMYRLFYTRGVDCYITLNDVVLWTTMTHDVTNENRKLSKHTLDRIMVTDIHR
jgi:hypothetical protein